MPHTLVEMIRDGSIWDRIDHQQASIDRLNEQLDQWEINNPEAAAIAPWAESRRLWKEAGRPAAPWYELLAVENKPLTVNELRSNVIQFGSRQAHKKMRATAEDRTKYNKVRKAASDRCRERMEERRREQALQQSQHDQDE